MPEVHLPHLEDDVEASVPAAPAAPHKPRFKGGKLLLEVALIGTGVFLGLMGEQWREYAQHKELAEQSLIRLRAEVKANREAVSKVREYHQGKSAELKVYLAKDPTERRRQEVGLAGIRIAFFEETAWDLAVATGSLNYFDSDLSYELSRIYTLQQNLSDLSRGLSQAMYVRSPYENLDAFLGSVATYYDDMVFMEPGLLAAYDRVLPLLEKEVGGK